MNIVVFIKQVPDTNNVKWTENNNIDRTKMDSILNPVDKQALEAALRIKEMIDSKITALTMGPDKAKDVLKEAIAMGVDDAVLLCDPKFAGSDTLATSKILSAAVKELLPDTDLIITGQTAIDGETGQTPCCTAARLNMPAVGHVNEIVEINNEFISVVAETEKQKITYKIKLPALISIDNYMYPPRSARIQGYINAHDYNYKTYNLYEINLTQEDTGVKGSPTYVSKVFRTQSGKNTTIVNDTKELYKQIKKVI